MRWLIFFIFAYLMLGAQIGTRALLGGLSGPNLVLLAVVYVCLNTARESALTGALVLGLLQDIMTDQPPGLYAFAYGTVGLLCTSTNRSVYAEHFLTHIFFAFVGQIIVAAVLIAHSYVRPPDGLTHLPATPLVWSALYTALAAPVFLGLLNRAKPLFGFKPVTRKIRPY